MFTIKSIPNLSISEPCSANLNIMNPTEKGKFCTICQKEVVDFTTMNENEIIHFFQNYSTPNKEICGNFKATQTNFNLINETKKIFSENKSIFKKASMLLIMAMAAIRIYGQEVPQIAGGMKPLENKNLIDKDSTSKKACNMPKKRKKSIKKTKSITTKKKK